MTTDPPGCPMRRADVVDRYFLEHRAKVLDVAAFLDRIERANGDGTGEDVRIVALRRALALLDDGRPERAKRVLELFSDPTTEPIDRAGAKGATGTWPDAP